MNFKGLYGDGEAAVGHQGKPRWHIYCALEKLKSAVYCDLTR